MNNLQVEGRWLRLRLREQLDLADEASEAQRLGVKEIESLRVERDDAILHRLDTTLEEHQGRPELVR